MIDAKLSEVFLRITKVFLGLHRFDFSDCSHFNRISEIFREALYFSIETLSFVFQIRSELIKIFNGRLILFFLSHEFILDVGKLEPKTWNLLILLCILVLPELLSFSSIVSLSFYLLWVLLNHRLACNVKRGIQRCFVKVIVGDAAFIQALVFGLLRSGALGNLIILYHLLGFSYCVILGRFNFSCLPKPRGRRELANCRGSSTPSSSAASIWQGTCKSSTD